MLPSIQVRRNEEKLKKLNNLLFRPIYDGQYSMSQSTMEKVRV